MKKVYLTGIICLVTMFVMSACQGGQKSTEEAAETPVVDYATIAKEELPSMEEFVDLFYTFHTILDKDILFKNMMQKCKKEIKDVFEPKGFTVEGGTKTEANDYISASKNCKFNYNEEEFSYSFTPNQTDSIAAAYFFTATYAMESVFLPECEILLADTCIYDALVNQIKEIGYILTETYTEEKYEKENPTTLKDCYFFLCDRKSIHISLNFDMVKAQKIDVW